jgi:hypothetical protein
MGKEEAGDIPFLDVLVSEGTSPKKTIYRKPTDTGRYQQFDSTQLPQVKN